jgi:glycosyl transferase family 25
MEKINKIFIINLKRNKSRLINSIIQLNKYKLTNLDFINAIDGYELNDDEYKSYTSFIGYYLACPSMVGCGMSHIKTWEKIIENNIEFSLILEDDFNFSNNFLNDFNEMIRNVPDNFDVLFLNSNYLKLSNINNYFYEKPLLIYEKIGYVISLNGAKKMLNNINKISYHLDFQICINHLLNNKKLNIISSKKCLIYKNNYLNNNYNNIYDYNYPIVIDKINRNYLLNLIYKYVVFNIFNIRINFNFLLILMMGYYHFSLSILLLIFEYFIIEKNNNLISNIIILYSGHLIKALE